VFREEQLTNAKSSGRRFANLADRVARPGRVASLSHKTLDALFARMLVSDQGARRFLPGAQGQGLNPQPTHRCFAAGIDGYKICESIKQNERLAGNPFMLLTGSEPFEEAEARRSGRG